jgi:hypothetical protein
MTCSRMINTRATTWITLSITVFAGTLANGSALAQNAEPPPTNEKPIPLTALPWPVKLGVRSQMVMGGFPLIDRVVLVPDGATYLDEISKWSGKGRWPVLFDDNKLAPMFVRRFKPAQLIRRESVGPDALPQDRLARQQAIDRALVRIIGGDPQTQTARHSLAQQNYAPPGVIVSAPDDPAWTAAIGLAAARGQLIAWMSNENFGSPDDELNQDAAERLISHVESLLAQTCAAVDGMQALSYRALGDDVDAITICRSIANRARMMLPGPLRADPGGPHNDGPVAITDLLGRNADSTRYAIVGWIFGDEARCAYMAMCSLFLPRDRATLWNTYPQSAEWNAYSMASAASMWEKSGVATQHMDGPAADVRAWLRKMPGGWSTDVVVINSKGNSDFFDLSSGTAYPIDVPVLNEPAALHLIHSWAMQSPANRGSVGGRWLDHGAYAAVGSCWEPYLAAFVPPGELANRWLSFVPFLAGSRWWDGQSPVSKPWRVVTIGDPLMVFAPPENVAKARVQQPADYGIDVAERVKNLMREAAKERSTAKFAEAISILNMLGRDDVAAELWRMAAGQQCADKAVARAALDPLFRRRDQEEFLRAFSMASELAHNDSLAVDMLWHLYTPRLTPGNTVSAEAMAVLEHAVRHPQPQRDVERLAAQLSKAFGNGRALALIQREIKKTNASDAKQALAELMDRY